MANLEPGLNKQRRRLMQGVALSAVTLSAPTIATAMCNNNEHAVKQTAENLRVENDSVFIELIESKVQANSGSLARVRITNKGTSSIRLSHLSPGAISTRKGVYQLNAMLQQNPLAVRPNGVYQFWLQADDGTLAKTSTRPLRLKSGNAHSKLVEISIVTETESGQQIRSQWVQAVA